MHYEWNPIKDGVTTFGDALATPKAFRVALSPDSDPVEHDVKLSVAYEDDRFVLRSVSVAQAADGPPVDADTVRSLPLSRIIAHAVEGRLFGVKSAKAAASGENPHTLTPLSWPTPERGAGPTEDNIRLVSIVYRVAYACGVPPTKYVEEAMGLARATAGRWIRLARERGLLGETEPGKKGV